jgi:HTH-type transcriptional regulator, competence development regulator
MKRVGETLRELRTKNHLLLREVASAIQIDQTLLSKIERDERLPTEQQVKSLSKFYRVEDNNILLAYLSDRVIMELEGQPLAKEALNMAQVKIQKVKPKTKK